MIGSRYRSFFLFFYFRYLRKRIVWDTRQWELNKKIHRPLIGWYQWARFGYSRGLFLTFVCLCFLQGGSRSVTDALILGVMLHELFDEVGSTDLPYTPPPLPPSFFCFCQGLVLLKQNISELSYWHIKCRVATYWQRYFLFWIFFWGTFSHNNHQSKRFFVNI